MYSVNPFYLVFGNVNGYFEEIHGNKYLMLVPTRENKEKIKKYEELQIKIRDLIRSITKSLDDYDENKTIDIHIVTIVVRAVFHKNNKYYSQVFLDECLYKI